MLHGEWNNPSSQHWEKNTDACLMQGGAQALSDMPVNRLCVLSHLQLVKAVLLPQRADIVEFDTQSVLRGGTCYLSVNHTNVEFDSRSVSRDGTCFLSANQTSGVVQRQLIPLWKAAMASKAVH